MIVAVAIDRAFVEPASVVFASIAENADIPDCSLVVLGLGLNDKDKDIIRQSSGHMSDRCSFVDLKQVEGRLKNLPVTLAVPSVVSYARLLGPDLLKGRSERLLYLDSDIVVQGSLRPLLDMTLETNVVAAVPDQPGNEAMQSYRRDELKLQDPSRYFNSGVLLIDVAKWNAGQYTEKAFDFIANYTGGSFHYLDQDVINAIMQGNWKPLPRAWNFFQYGDEPNFNLSNYSEASIVHFASGMKPWVRNSRHAARELYLHYRKLTPFADKPLMTEKGRRISQVLRSPIGTLKGIVHRLRKR